MELPEFSWSQFGIYHFRWQLSAISMLPLMLFLEARLPLWANLPVGHAFGACIFYFIDKRIFE